MIHWNRDKIIENLRETSQKLNHSPSVKEAGPVLYQVCQLYFGSFNKAKKVARLEITLAKHHRINKNARRLNEDLAYILGVIEGDAHCRRRKTKKRTSGEIILKVRDLDFAREFKKRLKRWSGIKPKYWEKNGEFFVALYSIDAVDIIQRCNLKKITISNKKIKSNFLMGLYDSEGGVLGTNLDRRKFACRWIHFSNSNKKIITIISRLLKDFGISYKRKSRIHSGFGSKKRQYEILIFRKENFKKFYKNISFSIKRKQKKLLEIIESYGGYQKVST